MNIKLFNNIKNKLLKTLKNHKELYIIFGIIIVLIIICICTNKSINVTTTMKGSGEENVDMLIHSTKSTQDIVMDKLNFAKNKDNKDKVDIYYDLYTDPKFKQNTKLIGLKLPQYFNIINENNDGIKLGNLSTDSVIVLTSTNDDYYANNISTFINLSNITSQINSYKVIYLNKTNNNAEFYKKFKNSYCVDEWNNGIKDFMNKIDHSVVLFVNKNHEIEMALNDINGYSTSTIAASLFGSDISGKQIFNLIDDIEKNPKKYKENFKEETYVHKFNNIKEVYKKFKNIYPIKGSINFNHQTYYADSFQSEHDENLRITYKSKNDSITLLETMGKYDYSAQDYKYQNILKIDDNINAYVYGDDKDHLNEIVFKNNNIVFHFYVNKVSESNSLKLIKFFI